MSAPAHRTSREVGFQHCDPAGIVFYPRYFEMLEEIITAWITELADAGTEAALLRERREAPRITNLECRFARPTLLGDVIDFEIDVVEAGAERVRLAYRVVRDGDERIAGEVGLGWYRFDPHPRATELPPTLHARLRERGNEQ
ncbi:acyl-CoA thioesterase [Arhodomonas sp. SL1]|uniref:acyl-CoA thioesterase n=1 Tax=Arhodomonas sp. SL1 TaxID=3425691 RepID=UPI003F882AB4